MAIHDRRAAFKLILVDLPANVLLAALGGLAGLVAQLLDAHTARIIA